MADLRKPEFWTNLIRKVLKQILQNAGIRTRKNSHNQHVVPHEEAGQSRAQVMSDIAAFTIIKMMRLTELKRLQGIINPPF